jgi:hypothetical protein
VRITDPRLHPPAGRGRVAGAERQPRGSRRGPAPGRVRLLGLLALPLVVAGCAATPAPAASTATTSAAGTPSSAAATGDANTPPAAAQMVCSDEIRREVAGALALPSVPTPQSTWADHVYTCTYAPPMGPLVLSVTVAPSTAAAAQQLETMRGQLGADQPESALGQRAFSAPNGTVLAAKDNMVLRVDPSALPDDLGATHRPRIDVARVLAAGVFNCWTGDG